MNLTSPFQSGERSDGRWETSHARPGPRVSLFNSVIEADLHQTPSRLLTAASLCVLRTGWSRKAGSPCALTGEAPRRGCMRLPTCSRESGRGVFCPWSRLCPEFTALPSCQAGPTAPVRGHCLQGLQLRPLLLGLLQFYDSISTKSVF